MSPIIRISVFILFYLVLVLSPDTQASSLNIATLSFSQIVTVEANIDRVGVRPWYASCPTVPDSTSACPPYFFPFGTVFSNASFPVIAPPSADFAGATGLLTNGVNNGLGGIVFFQSGDTVIATRSHGFEETIAFLGRGFNGIDFLGWTLDRIQVSEIQVQFTQPAPGTTTVNFTYTTDYFGPPPFSLHLPLIKSN